MSRTTGSPRRGWDERLALDVLVPLLAAYFTLCVLYAWQAWRRETPTIFTDELETAQISRAIAATGHPGRRGEPYQFTSLVPYFTAPAWWINSVSAAYAVIKYAQTLLMALTIFPAYGIARYVVDRNWAMFAAIGSIGVPALAYSPFLVEEPLAYPIATLALYLITRLVVQPSGGRLLAAVAACVLAVATRSQLAALGGVLVLCVLALGWRSRPMNRWRASWTAFDWVGAALLGIGAFFAFFAFMGRHSQEWATTNALFKGRLFDYGVWATGALAIGCGIVPLIGGIAALIRPWSDWREPGLRAWGTVTAATIAALCWYAAIKGAYLSTVFSSLVVERNLIYLSPLLFAGLARVLARRDTAWWSIVPATAAVLYIVHATPTRLDSFPYYEAHGLAILALANRELHWTAQEIEHALVAVSVVGGAALIAIGLLQRRRRHAARIAASAVAVLVVGWGLTAEIYAASGEHDFSARIAGNMVQPWDWLDRATGGGSVVTLGQQITDPTGIWLTEFWNRSVKKTWSTDGSAPGPGPTLTPNLQRRDGTLWPSPDTDYALAYNGTALQAPIAKRVGGTILYRLSGKPLKLAYSQSGVFSDGWMGKQSSYNRFTAAKDGPGYARIDLSRSAFCTTAPIPGGVLVKVGPIAIGSDKQAKIGRVTAQKLVRVRPCEDEGQTVLLPAPRVPWRVEVTADTFVPHDVDPRSSDLRELGAQVAFGFQPS